MPRMDVGGLALNVEVTGNGAPLLLLHGFTGSVDTWTPHLSAFGERHRVIAVDLVGHGESDAPHEIDRYGMERCNQDLVAVMERLGIERADVLGYSMGGRVALQLAVAHPERIRSLVLESASSGLSNAEERVQRMQSDEALADAIERDGVEAFVERWERLPLFATQAGLSRDVLEHLRMQRLRNRPIGLANSLRGMGTGAQVSLWERLSELRAPTLLIAGALDAKFSGIAQAMRDRIPVADVVIVPDAGHAVHLERPDAFRRLVLEFLAPI